MTQPLSDRNNMVAPCHICGSLHWNACPALWGGEPERPVPFQPTTTEIHSSPLASDEEERECFACHGAGKFEPDADAPPETRPLTCAECDGTGLASREKEQS